MAVLERTFQQISSVETVPDLEIELPKGLRLSVTKVKESGQGVPDNSSFNQVLEARKSYWVYGDVPLWDSYDSKSTIYLATAMYPTDNGKMTQEHITMRLVPANGNFGEPSGTEDVDLFVYKDPDSKLHPTRDVLENKKIKLENVATISRLGKIPSPDSGKNEHMAELFAMTQIQATQDAEAMNIDWIICQLHSLLQNRMLAYKENVLDFVPIEKQLNLEGHFQLNRWDEKVWDYTVRFPGYFFNIGDLKENLQNSGHKMDAVPNKSMLNSLGFGSWDELTWKNAWLLGSLMTNSKQNVTVPEEDLKDFNSFFRSNAKDGVFLALMKRDQWETSALKLLNSALEG